jgi:ABC-type spermidine/putrescine transport system permease subunit I
MSSVRPRAAWLLLPASLAFVILFLGPLAFIVFTSVYDGRFTLAAYQRVLSEPLFKIVLGNTFVIAIESSLISLALGYPIALHLSRLPRRRRPIYLMMVMLPFWTSILVKSFAFEVLLGDSGILNSLIRFVFGAQAGFPMLFNRPGVIVGVVNYLLPFMVLPVLASLLMQDQAIIRAAEIMGASRLRIFWRITFPLSLPGVLAGTLMNCILALGMFATPALLGGRRDMMIGNLIDFFTRQALDWNVAAALSIVLLLLASILVAVLLRVRQGEGTA